MNELKLKIALIKTSPRDMRNKGAFNLGLEIIKNTCEKEGHEVILFNFHDYIKFEEYSIIAFNVFYLMNQLNVIPFLQKNGIPVFKTQREKDDFPLLIGGGAGFINEKILSEVLDFIIVGEGEKAMECFLRGAIPKREEMHFWNKKVLDSPPVMKRKRAMIELTRGCKYKCNFCSYSWTMKRYREKDFELVKRQILQVKEKKIKIINFLSSNFSGYSKVTELIQFCHLNDIHVANTDFRIDDYVRLSNSLIDTKQKDLFGNEIKINALKIFKVIKVGLESPCEECRFHANKRISNETLNQFLTIALEYCSYIHFYLIYGLPKDNEEVWFDFIRTCKKKIEEITSKKIRIEFSITNFEPSLFTPFENEQIISFTQKKRFLKKYIETLTNVGFLKEIGERSYGNMRGRIGRGFASYHVYMWLMKAGKDAGKILFDSNLKGITKSLSKETFQTLYKMIENKRDFPKIENSNQQTLKHYLEV